MALVPSVRDRFLFIGPKFQSRSSGEDKLNKFWGREEKINLCLILHTIGRGGKQAMRTVRWSFVVVRGSQEEEERVSRPISGPAGSLRIILFL